MHMSNHLKDGKNSEM